MMSGRSSGGSSGYKKPEGLELSSGFFQFSFQGLVRFIKIQTDPDGSNRRLRGLLPT